MKENTYHIDATGLKIWRDGELIKHISADQFPNLILEMAKVLQKQ